MSKISESDITNMKLTRKVKLYRKELFWHYSIIPFLLIVPVLVTWNLVEHYLGIYEGVRSPLEIANGYLFIIPAVLFYYIQKKRLRLKSYEIATTEENFKQAFEKTAIELDWSVEQQKKNFIRAHRGWSWSSSWGELITIIREEDKILINSICDPNAVFISVVSYGQNKRNIKTFIENLKKELSQ